MANKDLLDSLFASAPAPGVRVEPLPRAKRTGAYQGVIPGAAIERVLVRGIQVAAVLLVLLSVLGTFYGSRGLDAPLAQPQRLVLDAWAAPQLFGMALLAQGLLALVQWGSRRMADRDPRWWLLYLGSLALSVFWNWSAYGDPMVALQVPWLVAFGIVIAGDVLPEVALVQE